MAIDYRLTIDAEEDVAHIYSYGFAKFGETQADRYYNGLHDRFQEIAKNPGQYPNVLIATRFFRRSVYYSDSIFFVVEDGTAVILAIVGSQDLKLLSFRLSEG